MSCLSNFCFFEVFGLLTASSDLVVDVGFFMALAPPWLVFVESVGFFMDFATCCFVVDVANCCFLASATKCFVDDDVDFLFFLCFLFLPPPQAG